MPSRVRKIDRPPLQFGRAHGASPGFFRCPLGVARQRAAYVQCHGSERWVLFLVMCFNICRLRFRGEIVGGGHRVGENAELSLVAGESSHHNERGESGS